MGFIQDPKTGAWYKEGATPPWLNQDVTPEAQPAPLVQVSCTRSPSAFLRALWLSFAVALSV